jgi:hypothetical protein
MHCRIDRKNECKNKEPGNQNYSLSPYMKRQRRKKTCLDEKREPG